MKSRNLRTVRRAVVALAATAGALAAGAFATQALVPTSAHGSETSLASTGIPCPSRMCQ